MTSLIMLFIRFVLRIPLRMSDEELLVGDDAIHGEDAYAFGETQRSLLDPERNPVNGDGELGPMSVIQGESPANTDEIGASKE